MKKSFINKETIEGRVFSFEKMQLKVGDKPGKTTYGKQYFTGRMNVAIDEDGLAIVPVHFNCLVESFKNKATGEEKTNSSFVNLKKIYDEGLTWENGGKEKAMTVRLTPSLSVNDGYGVDADRVYCDMENNGGFINLVKTLNPKVEDRTSFEVDMLITGYKDMPEREGEPAYLALRGYVFDFANRILPVEFKVVEERGKDYCRSLGATNKNPVFTKVWGKIKNHKNVIREENAWGGEDFVKESNSSSLEWVLKGCSPRRYNYGDPSVLTEEELIKALQDREVHLAEVKQSAIDFHNQKGNTATATGGFPGAGQASNPLVDGLAGLNSFDSKTTVDNMQSWMMN